MGATEAPLHVSDQLRRLVDFLHKAKDFEAVIASLRAGHGATLDGVRGSSSALVAAALVEHCPATLVVVCPHQGDIDEFIDDLALFTPRGAEKFPAWETLPNERAIGDEVSGDRLRLLKDLAKPQASGMVVTSIQSLVQPVPTRAMIEHHTRRLGIGDTIDLEG
ncbi:MAG TPA: transcription-repair coupling factor, partial [Pirellulales bacterium]|nr:transcription-repair coupling factor [Pirellulales bacterium]